MLRHGTHFCYVLTTALSRHFPDVLGIDGQLEEYAVITGN